MQGPNFCPSWASKTATLALVVALFLLSASSVQGALYIGVPTTPITGLNPWLGLSCTQASCIPSNPCSLLGISLVALSDNCTLIFMSGYVVPSFTLQYLSLTATSLTLTISSTGPVTWSNAVTLNMGTQATLLISNLNAVVSSATTLAGKQVIIQNSQFSSGAAQWTVSATPTLSISSSTFAGTTPLLLINGGTTVTAASLTSVTSTGSGVISAPSTIGSEATFTATNCIFTNGLSYPTSRFGVVLWNNVTAQMTAAGKAFGISPKAFDCTLCTLSSPASSSLSDTSTVVASYISVKTSTWTNIGASIGTVATATFQNFAVTMADQTASALDLSAGITSSLTFSTASFSATSATGALALVRLKASSANITVSNTAWSMTQASGATAPGLKLGTGGYVLSNAQTVPSTQLSAGTTYWYSSGLTWNGNVLDDGTGLCTWYIRSGTPATPGNAVALTAPSMTIGNVIIDVTNAASSFTHLVSLPSQGIKCNTVTNCLRLSTAVVPVVTWSYASLGLPTIGTLYPFIQGTPNTYSYTTSSEYSIAGGYTSGTSTAYYNFVAVTCNANCIAANSGPCVSTAVCTCKSGFSLPFCSAAPGTPVTPPTAPVAPPVTPVSPPVTPPSTLYSF